MSNTTVILKNLEELSSFDQLYWNSSWFRSKKDFTRARNDWQAALRLFVNNYAYERNVSIQAYWDSAKAALNNNLGLNGRKPSDWKKFETNIANDFMHNLKETKINPNQKYNPLRKSYNGKISIIRFLSELKEYDHNLVEWSRSLLSQGRDEEAYFKLMRIRGIGPKIATFWLRDICDAFLLDLKKLSYGGFVQPIDIWVYRAMLPLASSLNKPLPEKLTSTNKSYWAAAELMIYAGEKIEVRHTELNSAIWIFGSQLMEAWGEDFSEILEKPKGVEKFLKSVTDWQRMIDKCAS